MFNDNANSGFSSGLTLTALSQDTAEYHDDLASKDGHIHTPEHKGSLVDGVQQVNQDFELIFFDKDKSTGWSFHYLCYLLDHNMSSGHNFYLNVGSSKAKERVCCYI